jgi:hypothetical protein
LSIATNRGPACLYPNDVANGNRSLRVRLRGRKSNRDGTGAVVRLTAAEPHEHGPLAAGVCECAEGSKPTAKRQL